MRRLIEQTAIAPIQAPFNCLEVCRVSVFVHPFDCLGLTLGLTQKFLDSSSTIPVGQIPTVRKGASEFPGKLPQLRIAQSAMSTCRVVVDVSSRRDHDRSRSRNLRSVAYYAKS